MKNKLKALIFLSSLGMSVGLGLQIIPDLHPASAQAADKNSVEVNPNLFVDLAKKAMPSVVNISTLSTVQIPYGYGSPDDLFRRFFEDFFGRRGAPHHPGGPGEPNDEEGNPPATP